MESVGHTLPDQLLKQTEENLGSTQTLRLLDESQGEDHWDRLLEKPVKVEI